MNEHKINDKAPEFSLLNQDEVQISLADFAGKKVVLYFYPKDDTPGCTIEANEFSALYEEFLAKNAVILGISGDNAQSHCKFIDKFKLKHTLLCDTGNETARKYGAWGLKRTTAKSMRALSAALSSSMRAVKSRKSFAMSIPAPSTPKRCLKVCSADTHLLQRG